MPRKVTKSLVRPIQPDRLYNSQRSHPPYKPRYAQRQKQLAERLVYTGMETAAKKLKVDNPLEVLSRPTRTLCLW